MSVLRVLCPKCGCGDIREKNTAYAELPVVIWDWDEQEETIAPSDYDTDVSIDWERVDAPDPYVCHSCRWEGSLEALSVVEETEG